jgi:hypothetical protein
MKRNSTDSLGQLRTKKETDHGAFWTPISLKLNIKIPFAINVIVLCYIIKLIPNDTDQILAYFMQIIEIWLKYNPL